MTVSVCLQCSSFINNTSTSQTLVVWLRVMPRSTCNLQDLGKHLWVRWVWVSFGSMTDKAVFRAGLKSYTDTHKPCLHKQTHWHKAQCEKVVFVLLFPVDECQEDILALWSDHPCTYPLSSPRWLERCCAFQLRVCWSCTGSTLKQVQLWDWGSFSFAQCSQQYTKTLSSPTRGWLYCISSPSRGSHVWQRGEKCRVYVQSLNLLKCSDLLSCFIEQYKPHLYWYWHSSCTPLRLYVFIPDRPMS